MTPTQRLQMEERTRVFDDDLRAVPLTWRCGNVKRLYGFADDMWELDFEGNWTYWEEGSWVDAPVAGYIIEGDAPVRTVSASDLPVEFFNHQLMEVDTASEPSVFTFVSAWGLPFAPSRNPATTHVTDGDYKLDQLFEDSCEETDELAIDVHQIREEETRERGEIAGNEFPSEDYGDRVVSRTEAALTIKALQDGVLSIREHLRSGTDADLTAINRGACNPRRGVQVGFVPRLVFHDSQETLGGFGLLTSAICNQILETIADGTEWRECACEGCDVIFKRKQAGSSTPYSESIYCCKQCEERQKKRNQRLAAKNRIDHG